MQKEKQISLKKRIFLYSVSVTMDVLLGSEVSIFDVMQTFYHSIHTHKMNIFQTTQPT